MGLESDNKHSKLGSEIGHEKSSSMAHSKVTHLSHATHGNKHGDDHGSHGAHGHHV